MNVIGNGGDEDYNGKRDKTNKDFEENHEERYADGREARPTPIPEGSKSRTVKTLALPPHLWCCPRTCFYTEMPYGIFYTQQSETELLAFPPKVQRQIKAKIARLQGGFSGEIKKLNASDNIYRLRSGNYRILFEIEGANLVIRTIRDRKDAYE